MRPGTGGEGGGEEISAYRYVSLRGRAVVDRHNRRISTIVTAGSGHGSQGDEG